MNTLKVKCDDEGNIAIVHLRAPRVLYTPTVHQLCVDWATKVETRVIHPCWIAAMASIKQGNTYEETKLIVEITIELYPEPVTE